MKKRASPPQDKNHLQFEAFTLLSALGFTLGGGVGSLFWLLQAVTAAGVDVDQPLRDTPVIVLVIGVIFLCLMAGLFIGGMIWSVLWLYSLRYLWRWEFKTALELTTFWSGYGITVPAYQRLMITGVRHIYGE